MYARRKQWPLRTVTVRLRHSRVHAEDCADCLTRPAKLTLIERDIELEGVLDEEQRARLLAIANHCPVHLTLTSAHGDQDQTGTTRRRDHVNDGSLGRRLADRLTRLSGSLRFGASSWSVGSIWGKSGPTRSGARLTGSGPGTRPRASTLSRSGSCALRR